MTRAPSPALALALLASLAGLAGLAGLACNKVPEPPAGTSSQRPEKAASASPHAGPSPHGNGASPHAQNAANAENEGKAGKPTWNDPPGWEKRAGSNPMRVLEYRVPHAPGDSEDAECVVTTFGPGQGGSVDANVDRWVRQFEPDDQSKADKKTREVSGMRVTTVEIGGSFKGMAPPGAPPPSAAKKGQRMRGAIVEAPSGLWFFKLTGPDATVKAQAGAFDALLDSLKPGG